MNTVRNILFKKAFKFLMLEIKTVRLESGRYICFLGNNMKLLALADLQLFYNTYK